MPEPQSSAGNSRAVPCEHDYQLDSDLEMWVCARCGTSMDLVTQPSPHECGPDCDRHEDISAIG